MVQARQPTSVGEARNRTHGVYASVLVALDGSHLAAEALQQGMRVARDCGAMLVLLHVLPSTAEQGLEPRHSTPEHQARRSQAEGYLDGLKRSLRRQGVRVDWLLEEGPPADTIARVASYLERPLLVLAQVGTTASCSSVDAGVLGEVAKEVLSHWKGPVLLVNPHSQA